MLAPTSVAPNGAQPKSRSSRSLISRTLHSLSRIQLALLLLGYILIIHLTGLYFFTQGFLLTRLTLSNVTESYPADAVEGATSHRHLQTHERAIVLIIDALRSDFVVPYPEVGEADKYFRNVLTLPAELTAQDPSRSLLFDTHSDPPTSTMQRIKALMTGSLPTFIDAGSNFASTAILEDSIIHQLVAHNKSAVFMGDDTWAGLFPDQFAQSHPFESFNVEDLHTVDQGVQNHLFPYLERERGNTSCPDWDLLIGHFLGVDHVGHRTGPSTTTMTTKLQEMDAVLKQVVEMMDEKTLLVLLGDHGMDDKGDHGGDGLKETSAALWLYSKGPAFNDADANIGGESVLPRRNVLGDGPSTRFVDQIDLVPTLSLLLGLPIPFNNLGSVIPECFADVNSAKIQNRQQVRNYLEAYVRETQNSRLQRVMRSELDESFNANTLSELRALWAQFSMPHMLLGLIILGLSIPVIASIYVLVKNTRQNWFGYTVECLDISFTSAISIGSVVGTARGLYLLDPPQAISWAIASGVIAAEIATFVPLAKPLFMVSRRIFTYPTLDMLAPMITLLYSLAFAANSFLIWEDKMVTFFLVSLSLLPIVKCLLAPMPRLRYRMFGFSVALVVLVRLISVSTICREEQQPYCSVTFYAGSVTTAPPSIILYGILPLAWNLPRLLAVFLKFSRANSGPALPFLHIFRIIITLAAAYWLLEDMEAWDTLREERLPLLRSVKMWLARGIMGVTLGAGLVFWKQMPLCIEVKREPAVDQTGVPTNDGAEQVVVLGFANSIGSGYLLFLTLPFTIIFLVNQPTGQAVLLAAFAALLMHLECTDAWRDARSMTQAFANSSATPAEFDAAQMTATQQPTYRESAICALLGQSVFFGTGHQAVFSTIQWKSAFVGVASVVYPISPLLVIINTWGGLFFAALAVPLLATWNVSPLPNGGVPVVADCLLASLAFILHFASTTLASAVCSAWLRRHLMVWKVFAPRFMNAVVSLVIIELTLLVAIGLGLSGMKSKIHRTFKGDLL